MNVGCPLDRVVLVHEHAVHVGEPGVDPPRAGHAPIVSGVSYIAGMLVARPVPPASCVPGPARDRRRRARHPGAGA